MKRILAEYPYDNYYLYVIFHKNENRRYAALVPINKESGLKRKTISYARYLMSVKEKRFLNDDEEVDHIDNDKMNDNLDNLQILSKLDNMIKENSRHGRKMVELKCPHCKTIFHKRRGHTHLVNNHGSFTACSKKCSTTFGALKQFHPDSNFVQIGLKENVVREYISYKNAI